MARKQKFQFYLTDKEYQALQKAAEDKQVPMSEIVRFAIQPVLTKYIDCA
ncbi:MAG: ribbon-helix-helix domain-containing protein [Scytonema hyalinum WJT4-NPBG1]|jgi:hypothetical protein|nr:ribbon-helix-helix domain-containing protein [Scytonema hyalinum WJT4-NPBG1]